MGPKESRKRAATIAQSPLPKRSKNMPITLKRPCCVRCAQYVLDPGTDGACDKTEHVKCTKCGRLHKECKDIPAEFIPMLNDIFDEFDALEDGDDTDALAERVASVNKEMRAATRKANKEGGTSKPKSTLDAVMVLVKEQRKMNQVLTSMLDSYRAVNGLPPLAEVETDED